MAKIYPIFRYASLYNTVWGSSIRQSFRYNTGFWWIDRQTDRQTHKKVIARDPICAS